jgi:hypothetical protein
MKEKESERVRRRGRKLQCRRTGPNTWAVWGGEFEHPVTRNGDGFSCDCGGYRNGDICSHVVRVMIDIDPNAFNATEFTPPTYRTIKTFLKDNGYKPGQLERYSAAVAAATGRKPNYPAEIKETVVEMVYRFLKGNKS